MENKVNNEINNETEYYFFWKSNDNPFDKEKPMWTPYDQTDSIYLEECYQKYLKDVKSYKPQLGEYHIDFKQWMQIYSKDNYKQRPIIRALPENVFNIFRKNRYDSNQTVNEMSQPKLKVIEKDETKLKYGQLVNSRDYTEIKFKIIKDKPVLVQILKDFNFDFRSDELTFKTYVKLLTDEIDNLSKLLKRPHAYLKYIKKFEPNENFYSTILKMYTAEGFLYQEMNKVLRNKQMNDFQNIKYFYLAMMASFEYYSRQSMKTIKNKVIPMKNGKITVYRGSRISPNEIELYQKNPNTVRIVSEFLSTTYDVNTAKGFLTGKESPCLIEIDLDHNFKEGNYNFALVEDLSKFANEKEILLKSGAVIMFHKIK